MGGKTGKWMLYYRREDIDQAWDRAQRRIEDLRQAGVYGMKASTLEFDNPRSNESKFTKVLILYCGPHDDIELMKRIGQEIVQIMDYKAVSVKRIFYKTDDQTFSGTKATGIPEGWNHKTWLPIEQTIWSEFRSPQTQARFEAGEKVPMEEQYEKQMFTADFRNDDRLPSIRLHFEPQYLDDAWLRAKDLFEEEELPNCQQVVTETLADYASLGRNKNDHWIKAMR